MIKHYEFLAEHNKKSKIRQLLSKNKHEKMIFMITESSKANEPHKSICNASQGLDLRSKNKHATCLFTYYTWKKQ